MVGLRPNPVSGGVCLQASELIARVFKQIEQDWQLEMAEAALLLTSSRGGQSTRQLRAGPSPLLRLLQEKPWLPTWAGFQCPQDAILQDQAANTASSLEQTFAPIGPVTIMAAEVQLAIPVEVMCRHCLFASASIRCE